MLTPIFFYGKVKKKVLNFFYIYYHIKKNAEKSVKKVLNFLELKNRTILKNFKEFKKIIKNM